jgi:hypothetical protein
VASQCLSSALPPQYADPYQRSLIWEKHQRAHLRLHTRTERGTAASSGKDGGAPARHKSFMDADSSLMEVCLSGADFELYATFGPLTDATAAMQACTKLLRSIKKDEDSLFLLNPPKW